MIQTLIASILHNLRVEIKNVYFRFENRLSRGDELYAIGIRLKQFGIYTTNSKFDELQPGQKVEEEAPDRLPDGILDEATKVEWKKLRYKKIIISGLTLFCDFDKKGDVLVGSVSLPKLQHESETIYSNAKVKVGENDATEFKRILRAEFPDGNEEAQDNYHNYLMNNFLLQINLITNMNEAKGFTEPSTKSFPFLQGSILIGNDTHTNFRKPDDDKNETMEFTFYQRQMHRIMKSLETITEFGNMTNSAQLSILKNKADKDTAYNYSFNLYPQWLRLEPKKRTS